MISDEFATDAGRSPSATCAPAVATEAQPLEQASSSSGALARSRSQARAGRVVPAVSQRVSVSAWGTDREAHCGHRILCGVRLCD
jgi:hypothetical protein